ncbi:hypothetical protein BU25DRAFT_239335 [Macroventuria anomochaeta]|uniref:Uncharacterized protein n=1 Tax=Macroventuria anomochaeta TaxID=301207 RepID=A0ACB6RI27_9PLEO|nr:uncharacterized protein BU25DRAFT_239335 [Macroventuria anomochaeta]KAF2621403.1 hypothetical protein BU25DRAFT_239335 [Macroventuria anomochaeta]
MQQRDGGLESQVTCSRSIVAAYVVAPTSFRPSSPFLRGRCCHQPRHTPRHAPQTPHPAKQSTLEVRSTLRHPHVHDLHPLRPHHPSPNPELYTPTAKMVAMYTIAGRQVGSHVVR